MITVYSKKGCNDCNKAKTLLDFHGVEYEEVRIDEDDKARTFIVNKGHRSVPCFYVGDTMLVDGFNGLNALNKEELIAKVDRINED